MGAGRLATCGGRRPIERGGARAGECGEAAWHRPRPLARVTGLSAQCPRRPASDQRSQAVLNVRARVRQRGRRGAARRDVARVHALRLKTVSSDRL
jgi:hypothetical protein